MDLDAIIDTLQSSPESPTIKLSFKRFNV